MKAGSVIASGVSFRERLRSENIVPKRSLLRSDWESE